MILVVVVVALRYPLVACLCGEQERWVHVLWLLAYVENRRGGFTSSGCLPVVERGREVGWLVGWGEAAMMMPGIVGG